MGTDFEDENAKEKLRAMLNRQFGIGDVSSGARRREENESCVDNIARLALLYPAYQSKTVWRRAGHRKRNVFCGI